MTIFTGTFVPYEFEDKRLALHYVVQRCHNLKKSLRLVDKDTEHIEVRCPVSGDYLEITGDPSELEWLHSELIRREWYRTR